MGTSKRLEGKVAVVTGAGHGIGRASAHQMGVEGAIVAVIDVRGEQAEDTAEWLKRDGIEAAAWKCDVAVPEDVDRAISEVAARFGRIDVLHNNAGLIVTGRVHEAVVEDWDRVFAVNVRGVFLVSKAVIPVMQRQHSGSIVNTASIAGIVGEPHLAAYNASKAAVINLTRQMAVDYAGDGIRCNCVCPGWVDTGFNDPILAANHWDDEAVRREVEKVVPMNRQGSPEEIALAVVFLASDDAAYITGHPLVVDGGQMAL